MDIVKYIRTKPNYGYVIERDDGTVITVILGDSDAKVDKEATLYNRNIIRRHSQMAEVFSHGDLTKEEKIYLAEIMVSLKRLCAVKMEGLSTPDEQMAFVNKLSDNERRQLEEQIDMRIQAENYFSHYLA